MAIEAQDYSHISSASASVQCGSVPKNLNPDGTRCGDGGNSLVYKSININGLPHADHPGGRVRYRLVILSSNYGLVPIY